MTTIEDLLARTRLVDTPVVPQDVVPSPDPFTVSESAGRPLRERPLTRQRVSRAAGQDLRALCEALIHHTAADTLREEFIAERLPAPRGARTIACILQLSEDLGSARMWWQFAAGAGDDTSSYCLYLHHLSLGEADAASWWRNQTKIRTRRSPVHDTAQVTVNDQDQDIANIDTSTPTLLRVLRHLMSTTRRCSSEVYDAVMDFVPSAMATCSRENPDLELPVPYAEFAEQITIILAAAATFRRRPAATDHVDDTTGRLDRRDEFDSFWRSNGARSVPARTTAGTADTPEPARTASRSSSSHAA